MKAGTGARAASELRHGTTVALRALVILASVAAPQPSVRGAATDPRQAGLAATARSDQGPAGTGAAPAPSPLEQQRRNVHLLGAMGQLTRVIPHRVNTVGKLQQAIADGYRAFEVDLVFSSRDGGVYDVGHDAGSMAGIEIGELLATLGRGRIQKVWFDLKNLTEANLQQQMRTLTALDARFGLRDTVIVETSMESDSLRQVAALGFHTSYYLPTDRILQLLSDGQAEQLREEAILIAKQVRRQEVSAVSFDARLYPFVKKDLEPLIPKHIVYHTWDLSLALSHPDVVEQLRETSYFGDSRIRTILLPYQSPFSL